MLHVRISVDTGSLGLPLKQALTMAARLGADAVEIDGRGEITPREMNRTACLLYTSLTDEVPAQYIRFPA